jgi:hypothetical protein
MKLIKLLHFPFDSSPPTPVTDRYDRCPALRLVVDDDRPAGPPAVSAEPPVCISRPNVTIATNRKQLSTHCVSTATVSIHDNEN